jgi:hypothetical protein
VGSDGFRRADVGVPAPLVSETTRGLTSGFAFDDRGARHLEGIGEVHLYALRAQTTWLTQARLLASTGRPA